jgi:hypothetical protein
MRILEGATSKQKLKSIVKNVVLDAELSWIQMHASSLQVLLNSGELSVAFDTWYIMNRIGKHNSLVMVFGG